MASLDSPRRSAQVLPYDPRPMQLELLNEVARIATLDLELRPMLQRITDALARRCGWEFVALVTIDRDRGTFSCEALTSKATTDVHVGYGRPLGSGVVGEVAATGEPVLIDDVLTFPNYVETMPGTMSELCVPVKHHGEVIAVLNLESTRAAAFRRQLPLLTTVADQIAGAIASAQLYEQVRRHSRLMEMMSEVSRTALEATDLRELLDRVVRYIQERFPLRRTAIVLSGEERREFEQASPQPSEATAARLEVPIRFQNRILGMLHLESASPDVFTAANVLAFEAFVDQIAGTIHLASINERLAETSAQLEQKTQALEQANEHLAGAIETLHRISTQDGLTGVANRRHFDETLMLEWRQAARTGGSLSLLMLDIDYFKAFNDAAGHQNGDECLRRVAQTLRDSLHRAADLIARYGGEEFAILLPDTPLEQAREIAETLRAKIEELDIAHPAAPEARVTVSIGVATAIPPRHGTNAEEFVRCADQALYEAKRLGRNRVCC